MKTLKVTVAALNIKFYIYECRTDFDHYPEQLKQVCVPGGGGNQQSFIRRGSAQRSNPVLFYIPYLTEKVPLSYIFY